MAKPCSEWDDFVAALKTASVYSTQVGTAVRTRTIRLDEVGKVAKALGVPGNSPEQLKGSFRRLGGQTSDRSRGFQGMFEKSKFIPC